MLLLIVISSFHNRSRRVGRRIVVMIVCGGTVTILVIQYLPHNQLLLLLLLLLMSKLSTRRSTYSSITPICRVQHVSSDLVLQDEHLLHFLRTVRFGYTEHGLFSLDVGLPRRVVDDFVLDDLGGVALEDLHLHGLVGDHQVAHRMLVILVLLLLGGLLLSLLLRLLLCLLLCLLLLLQLMLLLGLLLSLLLSLLLLLLLDEGLLVGLLDHDELLSLLLLLTGAGTATAASSLVLLQMLALMQHEVVLLEEGLTTLAHVRSYGTATVRVASVVEQETVFGGEAFATVTTVVGLGFGLGHDDGLLVLDLLLDLLLLGLLLLLDHLNLLVGLLLLLLHLLVVLNLLLLLGWTLRLDGLLNHLAGGGDYLYLVHGREQMARNGRREGAQIRHQTLVAGVQTQVKRQRFPAIEGTATLAARVLWPRRRFRRTLSRSNRRYDISRVHILHRLLTLMVLLLNLLNLNVLLLLLLGGLLLGLLLSLLLGGGLLSGGLLLCSLLGRGLLLSLLLSGLLLGCLLSRLLLLLLLGIGGDHRVRGDDGGVGRVRVDSAVS